MEFFQIEPLTEVCWQQETEPEIDCFLEPLDMLNLNPRLKGGLYNTAVISRSFSAPTCMDYWVQTNNRWV